MATKKTIKFEAAAKSGMTIGEIAAFVDEARAAGAGDSDIPKYVAYVMRSTLRSLEVQTMSSGGANPA